MSSVSNIKVAVRIRPLNNRERSDGAKSIAEVNDDQFVFLKNIKLLSKSDVADSRQRTKAFSFDHAYCSLDPSHHNYASQEVIFQDLGTEVLESAFEGYNACVFAYGQTGSGKTYTMMGDRDHEGLIPRIGESLFSRRDDIVLENENDKFESTIQISYMEIYNERVRDLLKASSDSTRKILKVREDPKTGPYVQDLSREVVQDNLSLQSFLDKGNENRVTAATRMHDRSSRSHAIVTILFTQKKTEDGLPNEVISRINLVDLAGSERADPIEYDKERLKEGSNINKSLVTLGNVISALAQRSLQDWTKNRQRRRGSQSTFIPYRDSILTWLLKDSLGGNSKTIMIATISPCQVYYNEALNTLLYAQRAKSIINVPTVNEDPNVKIIRDQKAEIRRLKSLLASRIEQVAYDSRHSIETQAGSGSMLSLSDTSSILVDTLHQHELQVEEMTQKLFDNMNRTQDILQETDTSIIPLSPSKRSQSSLSLAIQPQLPHMVSLGLDTYTTGIFLYHFREGDTTIGSENAIGFHDIELEGNDIMPDHAVVKNDGEGGVTLQPSIDAEVRVNDRLFEQPVRLQHGDVVALGKHIFRFANPQEAARLREQGLTPSSSTSYLPRIGSLGNIPSSAASCMTEPDLLSPSASTTSFVRGDSWNDLCLEMEKGGHSEIESLQKAREELEAIRSEQKQLEEHRREREEELWREHELHKAEIDRKNKELARMCGELEKKRAEREKELEDIQDKLQHESERLKHLREYQTQSTPDVSFGRETLTDSGDLGIQSSPDLGTLAVQTDFDLSAASGSLHSVEIQASGINLDASPATLRAQEHKLKTHLMDIEKDIKQKRRQLEEMFMVDSERIELQRRVLRETEEHYKVTDSEALETVTDQADSIKRLERRKMQLRMYIREKKKEMTSEVTEEVRMEESTSEESVFQRKRYSQPTKSSLQHKRTGSEPVVAPISQRQAPLGQSPTAPGKTGVKGKGAAIGGARPKSVARDVTSRLYNTEEIKKIQSKNKKSDPVVTSPVKTRTKPVHSRSQSQPSLNIPASLLPPQDAKRVKSSSPRHSVRISRSSSLASVPEAVDEHKGAAQTDKDMHSSQELGDYDLSPDRTGQVFRDSLTRGLEHVVQSQDENGELVYVPREVRSDSGDSELSSSDTSGKLRHTLTTDEMKTLRLNVKPRSASSPSSSSPEEATPRYRTESDSQQTPRFSPEGESQSDSSRLTLDQQSADLQLPPGTVAVDKLQDSLIVHGHHPTEPSQLATTTMPVTLAGSADMGALSDSQRSKLEEFHSQSTGDSSTEPNALKPNEVIPTGKRDKSSTKKKKVPTATLR